VNTSLPILVKRGLYSLLLSRWMLGYIAIFTALSLSFAYLGLLGLSTVGFRAFSGALAAIINLNLYAVPLVSIITASLSIVAERENGTLEFHLSLPVTRTELFFAKTFSTMLAISLATILGYGLASWYLMLVLSDADLIVFLNIMGASLLMIFSFVALGMLISSATRNRFTALATSITLWIFFTLLYEVLLMVLVIVFRISEFDLWLLMILNPLEASRLLMIYSVDPSMSLIGELGNYLAREFGVVVTYSSLGAPLLYGSICLIVGLAWFRRINL
jgi:ABC-type transport system involved in multi-copper enzyme maturation permease subunit